MGCPSLRRDALHHAVERRWRYGEGVLLLRLGRQDRAKDAKPRFLRLDVDWSETREASLNLGTGDPVYGAIFFSNVPAELPSVEILLLFSGVSIGHMDFSVPATPTGTLKVTFVDADAGKPTPAATGLFTADNRLVVPRGSLSFDEACPPWYPPGRVRPMQITQYWPGRRQQQKAFFVDGSFSLSLSEGSYTLLAAKGMQYLPVMQQVDIKARETISCEVPLKRWVNMPSWYSADGHVHYRRLDQVANRRLMLWTQAEDVHVVNVLSFGDGYETFCPQYAYGKAGCYVLGEYATVPGQHLDCRPLP